MEDYVHTDNIRPILKSWIKEQPHPTKNCINYLSAQTGISVKGLYRILNGEFKHVEYFRADRLLTACENPAALLDVPTFTKSELGKMYALRNPKKSSPLKQEEWRMRKRRQRARNKAQLQ